MTERNSKIPGHGLGLGRGTLADSQFTPKSDPPSEERQLGYYRQMLATAGESAKPESVEVNDPAAGHFETTSPLTRVEEDNSTRPVDRNQEVIKKAPAPGNGNVCDSNPVPDHSTSTDQDPASHDAGAPEQSESQIHDSVVQEFEKPLTEDRARELFRAEIDVYLTQGMFDKLKPLFPTQQKLLENTVHVVADYLKSLAEQPNCIILRFGHVVKADDLDKKIGQAVSRQLPEIVKAVLEKTSSDDKTNSGQTVEAIKGVQKELRNVRKRYEALDASNIATVNRLDEVAAKVEHSRETSVRNSTPGQADAAFAKIERDAKKTFDGIRHEIVGGALNTLDSYREYGEKLLRSTASQVARDFASETATSLTAFRKGFNDAASGLREQTANSVAMMKECTADAAAAFKNQVDSTANKLGSVTDAVQTSLEGFRRVAEQYTGGLQSAQSELQTTVQQLSQVGNHVQEATSGVGAASQDVNRVTHSLNTAYQNISQVAGGFSTLGHNYEQTLENQRQQYTDICNDWVGTVRVERGERSEAQQMQLQCQQAADQVSNAGANLQTVWNAIQYIQNHQQALLNNQNQIQSSIDTIARQNQVQTLPASSDTRSELHSALKDLLPDLSAQIARQMDSRRIEAEPGSALQQPQQARNIDSLMLLVTIWRSDDRGNQFCLPARQCRSLTNMIKTLIEVARDEVPGAVIQDRSACRKLALQETVWSNATWLPLDREDPERSSFVYNSWFQRNFVYGDRDGIEIRFLFVRADADEESGSPTAQ